MFTCDRVVVEPEVNAALLWPNVVGVDEAYEANPPPPDPNDGAGFANEVAPKLDWLKASGWPKAEG